LKISWLCQCEEGGSYRFLAAVQRLTIAIRVKMAFLKEGVLARILVVDRDENVARLVARILRGKGHHVSVAFSAAAALAAVEISGPAAFDLVITNYRITKSGVEGLLNVGVGKYPSLFPRRVIVASGGFPTDMAERADLLRTQGFTITRMQKPLDIEDLERQVSDLLATPVPAAP